MNDPHITISIDDQTLTLSLADGSSRHWTISSATKGVGFAPGSHRTPTGEFVIREKIGHGAAANTIFRGRQPDGSWDESPVTDDLILARILRLDGLDDTNQNTWSRYIYLHGTNHEEQLGRPSSHGCIRMSREDIIALFELVPEACRVTIQPPRRQREPLIFFDCDSTLSSIEGIDELALAAGPQVFQQVKELTDAAMNGEIPLDDVFRKRMERLSPDRKICDEVSRRYLETMTPGSRHLVKQLRETGWTVVILSGGFEPIIRPLARALDIQHVEAVPLSFDATGNYEGYQTDYPTTRNGGKPEIIREWKQALLPRAVVMVGDGISDLETQSECDLFIGYGGVVSRSRVQAEADLWITSFEDITPSTIEDTLHNRDSNC
jgi:phosphoserine phosphatase